MIEFTKSYKVGDKVFATLEEAQRAELVALIDLDGDPGMLDAAKAESGESGVAELIVNELIKQRDKVIDILSTTATSKPRARRINGGTKKRKAITANAEAKLP